MSLFKKLWQEIRGDLRRAGLLGALTVLASAALYFVPWGGLPGDMLSAVAFILVLLVMLVHFLRRIALPIQLLCYARRALEEGNVAAAIVFAATVAFMGVLLWAGVTLFVRPAAAGELPPGLPVNAYRNLPIVMQAQNDFWPAHPQRSILAAQVEQETCPSLKSARCWDEHATNRNAKNRNELGLGLGQCTRNDAGLDCLAEARQRWGSLLGDWSWDRPYNATYQARAMVLKDKALYTAVSASASPRERLAMALVGYNAGPGTVAKRRALCAKTAGCDPARWFGHAELATGKPTGKLAGYGRSAADIASEYPRNIMIVRQPRYAFLDRV